METATESKSALVTWWMCICGALIHVTGQVLILDTVVKTHRMTPVRDKTNTILAPSNDSDQTGHPARQVRVFQVHTKKPRVLRFL